MFTIHNVLAENTLGTVRFSCDLSACHGACCTMPGGRGAPLEDAEVEAIIEAIPLRRPTSPNKAGRSLQLREQSKERKETDATTCINERDCVFVYHEGSVAKCAIEKAYFNGETTFRKPLSCHLFPIRVNELFGGPLLRYEKISECAPALAKGKR